MTADANRQADAKLRVLIADHHGRYALRRFFLWRAGDFSAG